MVKPLSCPSPEGNASAMAPAGLPAGVPFKRCGSCGSWLRAAYFGSDASRHDGLTATCRECRRRCYERNRTQARLRDAKNHQARRAAFYRARYEALLAALPDLVLDRLPEGLRPSAMQRRVHRAAHRKRAAGLPVTY